VRECVEWKADNSDQIAGGKKWLVRSGLDGLFIEDFGHEVALVILEAASAVEFDGGVAVGNLEVKEFGVVLAAGGLCQVEKLRANSLPAMGCLDEEFVNPCAFAAVFEAVVETNHQIADWLAFFAGEIDNAVNRIVQKFGQSPADRGLVKGLRPGIVVLHVAHQEN
jgi:hypothetical protein